MSVIALRRMENSQPWGFRLKGGTDQGIPLHVEHVRMILLSQQFVYIYLYYLFKYIPLVILYFKIKFKIVNEL